mgnify:CR=1 FL=1
MSDVTREQINLAAMDISVEVVDLNIEGVFSEKYRAEIENLVKKIENLVKDDKDIIIRSAKTRGKVDFARKLGTNQGLTHQQVSEKIAHFMGELAFNVCKKVKIKGLVLTGGDIAIKTAKLMGASGTLIKDEILPGIPYGYFISEDFKDLPVVTKAGAFGQKDALIKIIDFLRRG